jgi:hypothetical protein
MRRLKLMADYYCFPLWDLTEGNYGDVDPSTLPISAQLQTDLLSWADIYDSILVVDDPRSSAFPNESARQNFQRRGQELGERLALELGDAYSVEVRV